MARSTKGKAEEEEITDEHVSLFKRGLLARRFPGLKDLSNEDIKALIAADRKAGGSKPQPEQKLYPKTGFQPAPPKREQPSEAPAPFVPVSPAQAKRSVMRAPDESFIGVNTPYEAHHYDFSDDKTSDSRKAPVPFVPSCASQAKESIRNNAFYYGDRPPSLVYSRTADGSRISSGMPYSKQSSRMTQPHSTQAPADGY